MSDTIPFKGYDNGCHYCGCFGNAQMKGFCKRGSSMDYSKCGTHEEEKQMSFDEYIKDARDVFVNAVNSQKWNTKMRTASEDILIAYDQLVTELRNYEKACEIEEEPEEEKFRPSNGTEGMIFQDKFCDRCKFRTPEIKGDCQIDLLAMSFSVEDEHYPPEWIYDKDGNGICTKFEER